MQVSFLQHGYLSIGWLSSFLSHASICIQLEEDKTECEADTPTFKKLWSGNDRHDSNSQSMGENQSHGHIWMPGNVIPKCFPSQCLIMNQERGLCVWVDG